MVISALGTMEDGIVSFGFYDEQRQQHAEWGEGAI